MSLDEAIALAETLLGRIAPHPAAAAIYEVGSRRYTALTGPDGTHPVSLLARQIPLIGGRLTTTLGLPPDAGEDLSHLDSLRVGVPWPGCRGDVDPRAARLVLGWARSLTGGTPEVTAKVACSLDGCIATSSGESKWITGSKARSDGHGLRDSHDAIMVGIGTVLADDPRLSCRLDGGQHPVPVVLDSRLRIPPDARLLSGPRQAVVITTTAAPERSLRAKVIRLSAGPDGRVPIREALKTLGSLGLGRVLVEGGASVHRSLLDAQLVDNLRLYVAPCVIFGGKPWAGGAPLASLDGAPRFVFESVERVGVDMAMSLRASVPQKDPWGGSVT